MTNKLARTKGFMGDHCTQMQGHSTLCYAHPLCASLGLLIGWDQIECHGTQMLSTCRNEASGFEVSLTQTFRMDRLLSLAISRSRRSLWASGKAHRSPSHTSCLPPCSD